MRVLSVNNTADIYGASRCLLRLLSRFARAGHEVHVVLPEAGPLQHMFQQEGIRVHVCPHLAIIDRESCRTVRGILVLLSACVSSTFWMIGRIRSLQIDLVHSNVAVLPTPALAAAVTGRPHVWHIREFFSEFQAIWSVYQRYMLAFADTIIAVSCCVRDQFTLKTARKVVVVYDGLDLVADPTLRERALAFRSRFPEGSLLVGVVGRIKWFRKGQEVLVKAAALLRQRYPKMHLVIAGSAATGNEDHVVRLKMLIHELDLDDRATLIGELSDATAMQAAMDISVVPSVQAEPFGMVVLESMAAGSPVIGSRCGGIAEQIVDEESGFLVTPGDEKELASIMDRLLQDPALRQAVSSAGVIRARTTFDSNKTFTETEEIFACAIRARA